jgi:hypothetical protein
MKTMTQTLTTAQTYPLLNPRFVLWLKSRGLSPDQFQVRNEEDEITRVVDPLDDQKRMLPWTIVFTFWIENRWRAWGVTVGCSDKGLTPWEEAFLRGPKSLTQDDFDRWLESNLS